MNDSTRSYLAEFVGTFALVLIGTSVAVLSGFPALGDAGALRVALAFGGTLMVLVWTLGPVSGCHINPAVTIPMALSGRLPMSRLPGYIIAQFLGGVAASALLLFLVKDLKGYPTDTYQLGANGNPQNLPIAVLFLWEMVMTALFLCVIFSVTRTSAVAGFHGLAIGGFLFVAHLVGVPLGDSSLNPARSLGPAILEGGDSLKIVWLFITAPIAGGLIGWLLYKVLYAD